MSFGVFFLSRRDYFLSMSRNRVTSALGSIIENPSDIEVGDL